MKVKFVLYSHKSLHVAEYLTQFSNVLHAYRSSGDVSYATIPDKPTMDSYAELSTSLRRLLFFARPDVVICIDDGVHPLRPVFALEITKSKPMQDHWMQRFNNMVGCAQEGVPGAYILPFTIGTATKPNKYVLNSVFFYAYDRVNDIHRTPIYIAEWEFDQTKSKLVYEQNPFFSDLPYHNSQDIKKVFEFLDQVIIGAIHGRPISELQKTRLIVDLRNDLRERAYKVPVPQIKQFKRLAYHMQKGKFLNHFEFEVWLVALTLSPPPKFPEYIVRRDKNLIFVPQCQRKGLTLSQLRNDLLIERIQKRNADPYLGMPLTFDYIFCRLGETPYERDANLIIDLSILKFADVADFHAAAWKDSPLQHTNIADVGHIPTYAMHLREGGAQILKNFVRIYAYAADVIVFKDAVICFQ